MTLRHRLQEMFPELSEDQRELVFTMLRQVRNETRLPGSTAAAARFASLRLFGGFHALASAKPDEPLLTAEDIVELDGPGEDHTLSQLLDRTPIERKELNYNEEIIKHRPYQNVSQYKF